MNVNLKLDTQVTQISIGSRLIVACITCVTNTDAVYLGQAT